MIGCIFLTEIKCSAFDYPSADWDGLCDDLGNVPRMLLLLLLNFASGSRLQLMLVLLVVNIRSSLIHLCFLAASTAATAHFHGAAFYCSCAD